MNHNTRNIAAIVLIGVGLMSLMSMSLMWPMIIMLPGLIMLAIALWGGRAGAAAMSIPGMFVSGLGGLLFIQNWTGYWESWAYAWTLFVTFVGMGFMLMGQRLEERTVHSMGNRLAKVGLFLFAGFAIFFELIIGISGGGGTLGALILVGLGLFLLSREGALQSNLGDSTKAKRKTKKTKRAEDQLFTGPVVYGTRASTRSADRLVLTDEGAANESETKA
jgi:hypothetical protein